MFLCHRMPALYNSYITNDPRKDRKVYTCSGEEGREWDIERYGEDRRFMNRERITNIDLLATDFFSNFSTSCI